MTLSEKKNQLADEIAVQLATIVDRDYILLGLPYYLNIGDLLIWQGELDFLKRSPHRCLNRGIHYSDRSKTTSDTLVLLQGGGNFGDLWREIQEERLEIIEEYKSNPILIFPVTCYYQSESIMRSDAEAMSRHSKLTICARDRESYNTLKANFSNNILLVPDMAFCIDQSEWKVGPARKRTLFLKRTDKELAGTSPFETDGNTTHVDVRDWPSIERDPLCWLVYIQIRRISGLARRVKWLIGFSMFVRKLGDWYYQGYCRNKLIREGVSFVNNYETIYTTRLHVAILSILLKKPVTLIDNSYGKNRNYYETWLADVDSVQFIHSKAAYREHSAS